MGLIAVVKNVLTRKKEGLEFREVKADKGGGDINTTEVFNPTGDDSAPLPDDYVVLLEIPRTGGKVAIGYVDPNNVPKANSGEKRTYGRNTEGQEVNQLWLKNDGTIIAGNDILTMTLKPDGKITIDNGQHELIQVLSDTLQQVSDITTNTIYGGSTPINNKTAVQTVKTQLDTFKV